MQQPSSNPSNPPRTTSPPPPIIVDATDSNPSPVSAPGPPHTVQFRPAAADSSSHARSSLSVELVAVKRSREDGAADPDNMDKKRMKLDNESAKQVDVADAIEDMDLLAEEPKMGHGVVQDTVGEEKVGDKEAQSKKQEEGGKNDEEGKKEAVSVGDGKVVKATETGQDGKQAAVADKGGDDARGKEKLPSRGKGENKREDPGVKDKNVVPAKPDTEAKSAAVKGGTKVEEKGGGEDGRKGAEKAEPSAQDDDLEDEEAPFNLAAMSAFEYEQVAKLNPVQLRRYEQFRRSDLKNAKVKKVLVGLNPILTKASEGYIIAVKGLAKVFVGDVVETAISVKKQLGEKGPLQPKHLREAYRRLRKSGQVPSTHEHSPTLS